MFQILLVQPERVSLTMFARALQGRGFDVFLADNEKAGIECLRRAKPDLVLCGYKIGPSNDDLQMVCRMREINEDVPIIVASASGLDRVLDIRDAGAFLVISRNLDREAIAELVDGIAPNLKQDEFADERQIANRGTVPRNQTPFYPAPAMGRR